MSSGPQRGDGLRNGGAVLCGIGTFLLARVIGWGGDVYGLVFTLLSLLCLALGLPLLLLGVALRRWSGPRFVWLPAPQGAPPRGAPPLWAMAFVLPAAAGLALGLLGRVRAERSEAQEQHRWQAAIEAQQREGRPLTAALRACVADAAAAAYPAEVATWGDVFSAHVVECVLARPEAASLGFTCTATTLSCSMPVRTARVDPASLQDSPTYGESFREDQVSYLRAGPTRP